MRVRKYATGIRKWLCAARFQGFDSLFPPSFPPLPSLSPLCPFPHARARLIRVMSSSRSHAHSRTHTHDNTHTHKHKHKHTHAHAHTHSSRLLSTAARSHVACGTWHVARGTWHVALRHVACGMWHVACGQALRKDARRRQLAAMSPVRLCVSLTDSRERAEPNARSPARLSSPY